MFQNWSRIIQLAIPSVVSFAFITLTGTFSLIILGHSGALVIAVVGVTNIIIYNCFAIFSGMGHSLNYLVAQNFGEQRMKKAIERTYIALYLTLFVVIILGFVGLFASDVLLRVIGGEASKEIVIGESYLQLRIWAMALGIVTFALHGFLRGIGDARTPMVLSLISNSIVILLTYVLTYPEGLSISEILFRAGISFLIGEVIGVLGSLWVYFIKLHPIYETRARVLFKLDEAKLIFAESSKLGIQEFSISFSVLIFTIFVARLGEAALAANEIALNVMSLGFMPAFAFGATATILVGQEIGRGNYIAAKRVGIDTSIIAMIFIFIVGSLEFIFAGPISRIYSSDPAVFKLAAFLIMISAFLQVFDGWLVVISGGLRGIGDTGFLLRTSFGLSWFVFVPLAYLSIFVWDLSSIGAWISLYIFLVIFAILVVVRYFRVDWTRITVK